MKRQLMLEAWNKYSQKFIPPSAPKIQFDEMRKAFYAGAEILLFEVIGAFSPDHEPTNEDLEIMNNLHEEIRKFNREQGKLGINFTKKSGK